MTACIAVLFGFGSLHRDELPVKFASSDVELVSFCILAAAFALAGAWIALGPLHRAILRMILVTPLFYFLLLLSFETRGHSHGVWQAYVVLSGLSLLVAGMLLVYRLAGWMPQSPLSDDQTI